MLCGCSIDLNYEGCHLIINLEGLDIELAEKITIIGSDGKQNSTLIFTQEDVSNDGTLDLGEVSYDTISLYVEVRTNTDCIWTGNNQVSFLENCNSGPVSITLASSAPCDSSDNIGHTSVYGETSTDARRRAQPITATVAGDLNSISIYHEGGSGGLLLAVYDDNGGTPGTRLGVTPGIQISSSSGWETVNLVSPVAVSAGHKVWLAWVFESNPGIRNQQGSPGRALVAGYWAGGMPTDFGEASIDSYVFSIYATYASGNNGCGGQQLICPAREYCVNGTCVEQSDDIIGHTSLYEMTSTSDNRRAQQVTATIDGNLATISVYHEGGSGGLLLAIYDDNSGVPGTRLGVTPEVQISSSAGWETVNLTSPVLVTAGQQIWLAMVFESNPGIRHQDGTPGRAFSDKNWAGGMPTDFGTTEIGKTVYSIYATYD
jgi:hypothetical protein